jgi:hypothetical protein
VTYQQASATQPGDELAFDVLVISSSPGSGDMRGKFHDSATPILNWEEAIADFGAGELGLSAVGMSASTTTTTLTLFPHPITAGLPAQIEFVPAGAQTTASSGVSSGLTTVATAADGTVGELVNVGSSMVDYSMVIIADAGEAIDPGTGVVDGLAPARRVQFPMRDGTFALLTGDGRTLFGQALDWAAGLIGAGGGGSSLRITFVEFTGPLSSPSVTLRWTSEPAKTYAILGSQDLSGPRASWTVIQDNLPSGGAETASTVTLAAGTRSMFLVVRENP